MEEREREKRGHCGGGGSEGMERWRKEEGRGREV